MKLSVLITKCSITCMLLLSSMLLPLATVAQEGPQQDSPFYLKTQYAGDIGLVSVGVGKHSFREKLETDISLGYLPKSVGGDHIFTLALKAACLPLRPVPVRSVDIHPLRTGLQLGYTLGKQYFVKEPSSMYTPGYYGFSTAMHLYLFVGSEVSLTRVKKLEGISLYYELGTIGEYLISYVQNPSYLSLDKIFNLALGVKFDL